LLFLVLHASCFCLSFLAIAGTSAGVGFAIPSSTVLRIVPQLIQFGKVSVLMEPKYAERYLALL